MAGLNFDFDNSEVLKNLQDLKNNQLLDAIQQGLQHACLIIEAQAKKNCPVDDGQLRQSITHDVDRSQSIGIIGTNVEYAPYVEIGTGIYSTQGDGRKDPWNYQDVKGNWHYTHGQKPQPYLQKAADEMREEVLAAFTGLLGGNQQ